MTKKLYRLPEQGRVTGLSAGMAVYFDIDVTIVRVLWVIFALISGLFGAVFVYLLAALVIPVKGVAKTEANLGARVESLVGEVTTKATSDWVRNSFGLGLIALGVWLLLNVLWPDWFRIQWRVLWPAVLIIIGLIIVMRRRKH